MLHFRQDHPALRRGDMVNLLVARDRYAFLRSAPEEYVLVLLNRTGTNSVSLAVDDIAVPEGRHFKSFPEGSPDLVVTAHKLEIKEPKQMEIYWAERSREMKALIMWRVGQDSNLQPSDPKSKEASDSLGK